MPAALFTRTAHEQEISTLSLCSCPSCLTGLARMKGTWLLLHSLVRGKPGRFSSPQCQDIEQCNCRAIKVSSFQSDAFRWQPLSGKPDSNSFLFSRRVAFSMACEGWKTTKQNHNRECIGAKPPWSSEAAEPLRVDCTLPPDLQQAFGRCAQLDSSSRACRESWLRGERDISTTRAIPPDCSVL